MAPYADMARGIRQVSEPRSKETTARKRDDPLSLVVRNPRLADMKALTWMNLAIYIYLVKAHRRKHHTQCSHVSCLPHLVWLSCPSAHSPPSPAYSPPERTSTDPRHPLSPLPIKPNSMPCSKPTNRSVLVQQSPPLARRCNIVISDGDRRRISRGMWIPRLGSGGDPRSIRSRRGIRIGSMVEESR